MTFYLCCFREHAVAESSLGTFWFAGSAALIMWLFIDILVRSTTKLKTDSVPAFPMEFWVEYY